MAKKILIVEDDQFLSDLYRTKLGSCGYEVTIARDGEEATKIIVEQDFALILLDLLLPKISGFSVLEDLNKMAKATPPIIILSNLNQEEEVKKGIDLGAQEYLVKANFTPQEVIDKIRAKI